MDPYDSPKPEKKPRGCFFYGCLFSVILVIVGIIAICTALYVGYRYLINTAKEYSETTALEMPAVTLSEEQREALKTRVKAFSEAVRDNKPAEPLVLTADDINALIEDNPSFKGKAHVDLDGDKVKAKVSIPLKAFNVPELADRYINGEATLRVAVMNGMLDIRADSVEVKGKTVPAEMMTSVNAQNLGKGANDDPKFRETLDKIDRLEVKNSTIILTPRSSKTDDAKKSDDAAKPDDAKKPDDAAKPDDEKKSEDVKKPAEGKPAEPAGEAPKTAEAPKQAL